MSYRSCFDADYLESLIIVEAFGEEIDDISLCTAEILNAELKGIVDEVQYVDNVKALSEVKKHIRLKADEDNNRTRMLMVNEAYLNSCKNRGLSFYKDAQK